MKFFRIKNDFNIELKSLKYAGDLLSNDKF